MKPSSIHPMPYHSLTHSFTHSQIVPPYPDRPVVPGRRQDRSVPRMPAHAVDVSVGRLDAGVHHKEGPVAGCRCGCGCRCGGSDSCICVDVHDFPVHVDAVIGPPRDDPTVARPGWSVVDRAHRRSGVGVREQTDAPEGAPGRWRQRWRRNCTVSVPSIVVVVFLVAIAVRKKTLLPFRRRVALVHRQTPVGRRRHEPSPAGGDRQRPDRVGVHVRNGKRAVPVPVVLRPHLDGVVVRGAQQQLVAVPPNAVARGEADRLDVALVAVQDRETLKVVLGLSSSSGGAAAAAHDHCSSVGSANGSLEKGLPDPDRLVAAAGCQQGSGGVPGHALDLVLVALQLGGALPGVGGTVVLPDGHGGVKGSSGQDAGRRQRTKIHAADAALVEFQRGVKDPSRGVVGWFCG
mmetsp:Transcript_23331/g.64731  ORF Transcript_23331/g.64731 Transcript_23331/m.64731 type:complete len:404 (+) Transcript_23331:112-1323(+)